METHVKVLAILLIALGVLGLLAAVAVLLLFGGLAALAGVASHREPGAALAVPVLGLVGAGVALAIAVTALPGLVAGVGLLGLRRWARVVAIVVSAVNLVHVPVGTAVGVYGLWVLLQRETEELFAPGGQPRAAAP